MQLSRRGLLGGLVALVAAPAIVRVESLMVLPAKIIAPKPVLWLIGEPSSEIIYGGGTNSLLTINQITREAVSLFRNSNAFIRKLDLEYARDFEFARGDTANDYQWQSHVAALRPPQLTFAEWARKHEC